MDPATGPVPYGYAAEDASGETQDWPADDPGQYADDGVPAGPPDWPPQHAGPPGGYGPQTSAWADPAAAGWVDPATGPVPYGYAAEDASGETQDWPADDPGQYADDGVPAGPPDWPPQHAGPPGGYGPQTSAWADPAAAGWVDPATGPVPYGYAAEDGSGHDHGRRWPGIRRRWPLALVVVAAVAVAAVAAGLLVRGSGPSPHPAAGTGPAPSSARPTASQPSTRPANPAGQAVTVSAARRTLASWLAANNEANSLRSSSALARIESGTSYQMDAGSYRWTKVTDPGNLRYKPITFADPSFYIPAGSGYPQWFAVSGQWTGLDGSRAGLDAASLVFTRTSASAPWLEVFEPDLLPASSQIHIARTPSGYAEQLTAASASGLAVSPSAIQRLTAQYLDGAGVSLAGLSLPGNLQDLSDEQYWRDGNMPQGSVISVTHAASGDPMFALRTTGGGAVVFYDLTATMTLTAPPGVSVRIKIPGFYSANQPVTSAAVRYVDQFAAYVPPQGSSASPVVIASAGGIASRG